MPEKYKIESAVLRCAYCDKPLPVVAVKDKNLATFFEYDAPDMSQIKRVHDSLFHLTCIELPEFQGWFQEFLKKKGKFKKTQQTVM